MLQPDRLVRLLREWAAAEHGKRAKLHFEISSEVFPHAAELADLIEENADEVETMARLRDGREMILPSSKQHAENMLLVAESILKEFSR